MDTECLSILVSSILASEHEFSAFAKYTFVKDELLFLGLVQDATMSFGIPDNSFHSPENSVTIVQCLHLTPAFPGQVLSSTLSLVCIFLLPYF